MGGPVSYLTLQPGAPVWDRLGADVGTVERAMAHGNGMFDGLLVKTRSGLRFVDAPEVRRITHDGVTLAVTLAEVENADAGTPTAPVIRARSLRRGIARAQRSVPVSRWGRTHASDADRHAAVASLKRAYIEDRITTDELADLVARAHDSTDLDTLERVVNEAGR